MPFRTPRLCGPAFLGIAICALSSQAKDPAESESRPVTPDQPLAQRKLQGETEQVARRLGTMLRFMAYHRLDQGDRQPARRLAKGCLRRRYLAGTIRSSRSVRRSLASGQLSNLTWTCTLSPLFNSAGTRTEAVQNVPQAKPE